MADGFTWNIRSGVIMSVIDGKTRLYVVERKKSFAFVNYFKPREPVIMSFG